MKILSFLYYVGAITLFSALCARFFFPSCFPYMYLAGALLFASMRFFLCPKVRNTVLKRLIVQQQLAGLLFVVSAVLCFTHVRNEWIVALTTAVVVELYTAFRISHESEK